MGEYRGGALPDPGRARVEEEHGGARGGGVPTTRVHCKIPGDVPSRRCTVVKHQSQFDSVRICRAVRGIQTNRPIERLERHFEGDAAASSPVPLRLSERDPTLRVGGVPSSCLVSGCEEPPRTLLLQ